MQTGLLPPSPRLYSFDPQSLYAVIPQVPRHGNRSQSQPNASPPPTNYPKGKPPGRTPAPPYSFLHPCRPAPHASSIPWRPKYPAYSRNATTRVSSPDRRPLRPAFLAIPKPKAVHSPVSALVAATRPIMPLLLVGQALVIATRKPQGGQTLLDKDKAPSKPAARYPPAESAVPSAGPTTNSPCSGTGPQRSPAPQICLEPLSNNPNSSLMVPAPDPPFPGSRSTLAIVAPPQPGHEKIDPPSPAPYSLSQPDHLDRPDRDVLNPTPTRSRPLTGPAGTSTPPAPPHTPQAAHPPRSEPSPDTPLIPPSPLRPPRPRALHRPSTGNIANAPPERNFVTYAHSPHLPPDESPAPRPSSDPRVTTIALERQAS